jgi:hypothetical protein
MDVEGEPPRRQRRRDDDEDDDDWGDRPRGGRSRERSRDADRDRDRGSEHDDDRGRDLDRRRDARDVDERDGERSRTSASRSFESVVNDIKQQLEDIADKDRYEPCFISCLAPYVLQPPI